MSRQPGVRRLEKHRSLPGAGAEHRCHIAGQGRRNRGVFLPFRMIASKALEFVEDELRLERERGLGPERAVVVEDGDPRRRFEEVGRSGRRRPRYELQDRLPRRAVIPRRERVRCRRVRREDNPDQEQGENQRHPPRTHDRSLIRPHRIPP